MFIKMIADFSGFSVLGFIMVSSNYFGLNEVFQLSKISILYNLSFLQEFAVC